MFLLLTFVAIIASGASVFLTDTRITNGTTPPGIHPYMASVQYRDVHICGGAIIGSNKVLTSASCLLGFSVRSFNVRFATVIREAIGPVISVAKVYKHPQFSYKSISEAVLILREHIDFATCWAEAINIAPVGEELPVGALANFTGWGVTEYGGMLADSLLFVQLPRYDDVKCNETYGGVLQSEQFCFGYEEGGSDACVGDFGGPLVWNGVLYGILTGGSGCGHPNSPKIFTKVSDPIVNRHIQQMLDY